MKEFSQYIYGGEEGNSGVTGKNYTKKRVLRFCATGLLTTTLHVFIVWIMVGLFLNSPPLSNGVAFIIATMASYTINTQWSFSQPLQRHTFYKFICVSMVGFFTSVGIAWAAQKLEMNYLLGLVGVILIVPTLTFVLHSIWTYPSTIKRDEKS
ncbi:GtrA family protein [Pseudomonas leptonychotis]|uniref:GtrA family protein n=1 Tax=Pseudomonas leptonychotis TaxID=2448482 RepID=A0A4T2A155_9PSED|nr:GtrA family protein [Pseudomonas leptonychotis]TIH09448.1 GtrA family protein [Pseudomonas leptonychotis]